MTAYAIILLVMLAALCAISTYSDFVNGIIPNIIIVISIVLGSVVDIIYFINYPQYFSNFIFNLMTMTIISIILYAYHIWAAGDSKLLIAIMIMIPGEVVYDCKKILAPTVSIIVISFAIAFVYIVAVSIAAAIRDHHLDLGIKGFNIKIAIKQYVFCVSYVTMFDIVIACFASKYYSSNLYLIWLIKLIIVISVINYSKTQNVIACIMAIAITIFLGAEHHMIIGKMTGINYKWLILVLAIIFLRMIAERYNYQTIKTENIKKGDVLSAHTVLLFENSKIVGLPHSTTEDIRSRVSENEVESILRWRTSSKGRDELTIVKKIPFAVFISLGTIVYLGMRFINI